MSKHTPGPWTALPAEDGVPYLRVRGTRLGGRYKVANVLAPRDLLPQDDIESSANVRLVAAAPELLDALMALAWAFEVSIHDHQDSSSYQAAQAAIAKATSPS